MTAIIIIATALTGYAIDRYTNAIKTSVKRSIEQMERVA